MITNKDLSIDSENGKITLNGNKYDLGTQGEIDTAVKDVYSVMGQNGAKNLIPYPYASNSYSSRGITFTCLSDGTINANGTNDGTGNSTFMYVTFILSKGSYVINGCPTQTGTNHRCGIVRVSDDVTLAADYGRGAKFTLNADTEVKAFVQVYSGKTANNITFKPMLRLASDTDNTYQPYAMTNKQLTEQVADVKGTIGDITQTGVTGSSVAEQLETLGDKVEITTITPSLSTGFGSDNGSIIVSNGVCYFAPNFFKDGNFTVGTVETIGQLPNTCYPKVQLRIPCYSASADFLGILMISAQGEITYYPANISRYFGYCNAAFEVQ